ncbi:COMM domain containing protein 1 [Dissostichus eleginoides]|uniref:COMM domain containing protein 1 n=1 Tax=Dissostichus eleginoides TaxID=100907 RepID=A0AAD9BQC3_DISEL|nr:COMM domain containing protein 1 [Dissostichus eleginoides]
MDPSQLEAFLTAQTKRQGSGGLGAEQAAALSRFWKSQRVRVRESLLSQSRWEPGLRGLSWRVDLHTAASRGDAAHSGPVALMELGRAGQMGCLDWIVMKLTALLFAGDWVDAVDRLERADAGDRADAVDRLERVDAVDRANAVNRANAVDRANAVNKANAVDRADAVPTQGRGMFSLAVSIPLLENTNSLQQVLKKSDPVKNVEDAFASHEVYVGRRVVAAKVLKPLNGPVLFRLTDKNEVGWCVLDICAAGSQSVYWRLYLIPKWHFSVAVNIPEDPTRLAEAFYNINLDDVKKVLNQGQVYIGSNAVVAVPQKKDTYTDHAEAQTAGRTRVSADGGLLETLLSLLLDICNEDLKRLITNRQFSVAVNIPEDQEQLAQAFADIDTDTMRQVVSRGGSDKATVRYQLNTQQLMDTESSDKATVRYQLNTQQLMDTESRELRSFEHKEVELKFQGVAKVLFRLTDPVRLTKMKVAGVCWISVLLAVSLSIGDCEPSLDLHYVTSIAERIETNYLIPKWHFSVAVNIPEDPTRLAEAFYNINLDDVKKVLNQGQVYIGSNAVVAVPQKKDTYTDHAEAQVLDNLGNLANTRQGKILVLYSWLSPCGDKCTNINNRNNILKKILDNVLNKWKSYAFVFHTVYPGPQGKPATEDDIKGTLRNLRQVIVDDNIFRCYNPKNRVLQCVKCFVDPSLDANPVAACVKN